jgi:xylulokinase
MSQCGKPERVVAAGGGARSEVLLQIKASVFGIPFLPVANPECGLMGAAALAMAGLGVFPDPHSAVDQLVEHLPPVLPDPALAATYRELSDLFVESRQALRPVHARLARFSG